MDGHYTYLLLNLAALSVPLLLGLHPKVRYYQKWPGLIFALLTSGLVHIIWDIWKTNAGVWGFNPQFTLAPRFFGLPLEEILFFVVIPFSSLFIYHSLGIVAQVRDREVFADRGERFVRRISIAVATSLLIIGLIFREQIYTFTILGFNALVILLIGYLRPRLFKSLQFWLFILISYVPFLLVNGILTGLPVVVYNNLENWGIRIGTIPLEDFFYSFSMLASYLLATLLWEQFWHNLKSRVKAQPN